MNQQRPTFISLAVKTIVVHSVTYFICGILAFLILDYESKFADPTVRILMRQTDEPIVMAGPLFQPIRGLLFAVAFFPIRTVLFGRKNGWLIMWTILVTVGILSTFGPSPGSVEGMIYTVFPIPLQLFGMTEVLAQSLLLSTILCYWINHPEKRWLPWLLGAAFLLVLLLPTMGLLLGSRATVHRLPPAYPADITKSHVLGVLRRAVVPSEVFHHTPHIATDGHASRDGPE